MITMDIKKLRQKILDLAIRGKLVPQDPNDEPASVLLERIRAEKERLIAEGKIKRPKKSKASSAESHYQKFTPPFPIPDSWEWVRLGEIAYVASGSTPSKESFTASGIPYLKMYNLRNQKIDFDYHPQYISEEIHNGKLARSRAQSGDLIMNIVGPPLGKLAIIPESIQHCNFNQAAVMIRPYLEVAILNQYLFFYLSEMSEINSIVTKGTAGQTNISLSQSQNMRIPHFSNCQVFPRNQNDCSQRSEKYHDCLKFRRVGSESGCRIMHQLFFCVLIITVMIITVVNGSHGSRCKILTNGIKSGVYDKFS